MWVYMSTALLEKHLRRMRQETKAYKGKTRKVEKPKLTRYHKGDRLNEAQRKELGVQQRYRLTFMLVGGKQQTAFMETYVPTRARGKNRGQQEEDAATWLFLRTQQFIDDLEEHDGIVKFSYDIGDKKSE